MSCDWKPNWDDTKQNFLKWWNHEGLVFCMWDTLESANFHEHSTPSDENHGIVYAYTHPHWRAKWNHDRLSRRSFPADSLPISVSDIGPGSLALFMGSDAVLADDTVWFLPSIDPDDPEGHPPLHFDPDSKWWAITELTLKTCAEMARGKYLVGCPDLVENVDIVAASRDPQLLLMDMVERPDW
ncbi:MAG: hypothetical protein P1S60_14245, partial [Anaerolineae bacterium]|nr:hypothetical protein [Anaerolineae bacterium]